MNADNIKDYTNHLIQKSIDTFSKALATIRTGRASAALVDQLKVNYQGSRFPVCHVASIVVCDARSLSITPWDKQAVGAIEKAILISNLGLTPNIQGETIRISLPALTEERRKELSRMVDQEAEIAKISIRDQRREARQQIRALAKAGGVSEDEVKHRENEIQALVDAAIKKVSELARIKQADIMI